ncbi:hypothetical protein DXG01_010383 [Tephrocybe rancida]|nr:hypothetical protein DXG01_010383 [Tephrocybe rancida]
MVPVDASISFDRPTLPVPQLAQVRDILAHLQGPIISTAISRAALPVEEELYDNDGKRLLSFIHTLETRHPERFVYGSLEYPFTLPDVAPDRTTPSKLYPGGTFHQDTFTPNPNLTTFYRESLLPLLESANQATGGMSVYYHLTNRTTVPDRTAKFTLDAQLLAQLSHRASIGKLVAESKYAADVTKYTSLIQSQDTEAIRALVTNRTQEQVVLSSAANASAALAAA